MLTIEGVAPPLDAALVVKDSGRVGGVALVDDVGEIPGCIRCE